MERNNENEVRFSPIIEEEIGLEYIRTDGGEDYYTTNHEIGSQEYGEVTIDTDNQEGYTIHQEQTPENDYPEEESYPEIDKYLFRLGILNYLEKVEVENTEGERQESVDMSNIWNIL